MKKFLLISFLFFVLSCSYHKKDMCSINGNDYYLNTDSLSLMVIPNSSTLPLVEEKYNILDNIDRSDVYIGKDLDICPPVVLY